MFVWLVEYAAFLLNRHEVGQDGRTAYERLKGKRATSLGVEIGEKLMWKEKKFGKLSPMWEEGISSGFEHYQEK